MSENEMERFTGFFPQSTKKGLQRFDMRWHNIKIKIVDIIF